MQEHRKVKQRRKKAERASAREREREREIESNSDVIKWGRKGGADTLHLNTPPFMFNLRDKCQCRTCKIKV